jgi:NADH dehydrogenase/NADH:ubiquinone oxidoreductase subunit G
MSDTVTLTIDGRQVSAPAGTTIMAAARSLNILIPGLCSNEELNPYGSCRLCMVEITHHKRVRLVASCIYEIAEGLEVKTDTERVLNVRRLVLELLLARNPYHPRLKAMAKDMGIDSTRFQQDYKGCILCGQCVRTCREVAGVSALGFKGRGKNRTVTTPFDKAPEACIACGSCAYICPMNFIPLEEKDNVRTIWKTKFPMKVCKKCGRPFAPEKQLEHFRKIANLPDDHFDICTHCR